MAKILVDENLLKEADFWLEGALTCKTWNWDADQHEAATLCRNRIVELLKPAARETPIRLSSFQRDVLQHLFEDEKRELYSSLHNIAVNLQCEKNRVRLACRALKRKGLAKQVPFHDDEGFIRGSGYGITPAGIAYAEKQGWKGGDE